LTSPHRYVYQSPTVSSTAFKLWGYSESRQGGMLVSVTAGALYYFGVDNSVSTTTGMFIPVGVPIFFGEGGLDPRPELWAIASADSKVLTWTEELDPKKT
jgi:hypothetical protein